MVERSPYLTAFSHLIMVLGVIIVGFPLYLAFVVVVMQRWFVKGLVDTEK